MVHDHTRTDLPGAVGAGLTPKRLAMAGKHQYESAINSRYQALSPEDRAIRLIQIEPLDKDELGADPPGQASVCCRLQYASLNETVYYTALSYTWGDPTVTKDIILDGRCVPVTTNLELALRQLAIECRDLQGPPPLLWVDYVCIDQQNETERTQQVSQMDATFGKATQTVVWLGSSSEDSKLAMDFLRELNRAAVWIRSSFSSWSRFPFGEGATIPVVRDIQNVLDQALAALRNDDSTLLSAIGSLFERPWFRRVWVIQERVLSMDCVVYCGSEHITWTEFYGGFWVLCGLRDYLNLVGTGQQDSSSLSIRLTGALDLVTPVAFTSGNSSLLQLFSLLSRMAPKAQLQASDRRDYVYALLGLIDPDMSPSISVDYRKDWATVQTEVAKACLAYYGPTVLSFSGHRFTTLPTSPPVQGVPSWAPDWSSQYLPQPLNVRPVFVVRGGNSPRAYSAAKDLTQILSEEQFSASNGRLFLGALYVDNVDRLGHPISEVDASYDDAARMEPLRAWLWDLRGLLPGPTAVYRTAPAVDEALWRTPIADRAFEYNFETARASEATYLAYKAVLRQDGNAEGVTYANIAYNKLFRRRPFRSTNGYLGLGPLGMREGDSVWILPGVDAPFVLRPVIGDDFVVIGEAYVHGIMDGELLDSRDVLCELRRVSIV